MLELFSLSKFDMMCHLNNNPRRNQDWWDVNYFYGFVVPPRLLSQNTFRNIFMGGSGILIQCDNLII